MSGRLFCQGLAIAGLICVAPWVYAHDIPNARIDRSAQVILAPGRLRVDYEVSLAELTLAQDLRQLDDAPFVGDRADLWRRYAQVVGPLNARGWLVAVDSQEVQLEPVDFAIATDDHLRITFRLEATIPPAGELHLRDTNYASAEGSARLAFQTDPGVVVAGAIPPAAVESIPWVPAWQMTDEQERRSKQLDVAYHPTLAPLEPIVAPAPSSPPKPPKSSTPARSAPGGLIRLLDRGNELEAVGWLVTAFLLGVAHAVQPGHGKSLVAAATLDGPHAASRGVGLGLWTAGCHLITVAALAALLWWFQTGPIAAIHGLIARGSGFLIAAIGMFRVGRHLAGINPSHTHAASATLTRPGGSIWTLGLAAGLVPCWDAVALVVLANSLGRLGWGLTLLVAFNLGLAVVLGSVGYLAGWLRHRFQVANLGSQSQRWVGLASGLILAAIGLGLLGS